MAAKLNRLAISTRKRYGLELASWSRVRASDIMVLPSIKISASSKLF
jgi:hypothetical protein